MLSLLEVAERTQKGPKMEEQEWNLALFRRMNDLSKEYGLGYPGDGAWFNLDDAMAHRAFEAGLRFLAETGAYCISTNRIVQFTKQEILHALRDTPSEVMVGEGKDARTVRQRRVEGKDHLNLRAAHCAPFSEDVAPLVVKNFAEIVAGDFIEGFNFVEVDGRGIFGMPIEAYAARREVAWMRDGVHKAGRAGMAIVYYPISTRAAVLVAPMDPEYGLRRTDGIILSILPDIKIEHDLLTAAVVYEDYGCFRINGGGSGWVGGFCGGLGGAIIEATARAMLGAIAYHASLTTVEINHMGFTTHLSTVFM